MQLENCDLGTEIVVPTEEEAQREADEAEKLRQQKKATAHIVGADELEEIEVREKREREKRWRERRKRERERERERERRVNISAAPGSAEG